MGTYAFKEERLNCIFVPQDWLDCFPNYCFINGVSDRSYHTPLWLQLYERRRRGLQRPFHFENAWLEEEDLPSVVTDSWPVSSDMC